MRSADMDLASLRGGMKKYPQTMINVRVSGKVILSEHPDLEPAVQAIEKQMGSRGRVLLRPSGTEPLVRVMIEGEDADEVESLCKKLAAQVEKILS